MIFIEILGENVTNDDLKVTKKQNFILLQRVYFLKYSLKVKSLNFF